jgi:predicted transglutaminase-like cysteine proteinase
MARSPLAMAALAGVGLLCASAPTSLTRQPFDLAAGMWQEARETLLESVACVRNGDALCAQASAIVKEVQGLPPRVRLELVNQRINTSLYQQDDEAYGEEDYWAPISQFLDIGGDCEDFAIAKYAILRSIGHDPSAMHITIAYNQRTREHHAYLAVQAEGERFTLDSEIGPVVAGPPPPHMVTLVAMNEQGLWFSPAQPLDQPVITSR